MRKEEPRKTTTEDAKCRGDEEGVLASAGTISTAGSVGLNDGEEVGTDECANFAKSSGDSVVLAANSGGGGFRGDEADVVAWADFTEGEEDAEGG